MNERDQKGEKNKSGRKKENYKRKKEGALQREERAEEIRGKEKRGKNE